jgi:uncharacterized protein YndB with AHSA1/START domain
MNQQTSEIVIEKSVTVAVALEDAYRVFTEEIHTWWPLRTHAVDTEKANTVVLEGREGGRLYERTSGGEEHIWGTVVVWNPPHRVGYSWHPGRGAETAQEVEVTFTPAGDGTRVHVRHWGWEKLGDRLDETVANYNEGWDVVLGRYVEAAEKSSRTR